MEVLIHDLGMSGDGIGRMPDGRVVFVQDALPGDVVQIELTQSRKRVQHARVSSLVQPSPHRTSSLCQVDECGGCALKSFDVGGQNQLKRNRVAENLRRIGKLPQSEAPAIEQIEDAWRYRHRVRLHAAWSGQSWRVGFHERRSNELAPFQSCPVLWPELDKVVTHVARGIHELPESVGLKEVEIVYSRIDCRAAAKITLAGEIGPFTDDLKWFDVSKLSGVIVQAPNTRWSYGNVELHYDHASSDEFALVFEPGTFTQAHPAINDLLVQSVFQAVEPWTSPNVLELHAGIGNLTIPLARGQANVTAYEANPRAAQLCERNAEAAGVAVSVHAAEDREALANLDDYDVLLLDPPRAGAAAVAQAAASHGPKRIVYVSCDSATLARDVATLQSGGYVVTNLRAFDMFPQTPHAETLVILERE